MSFMAEQVKEARNVTQLWSDLEPRLEILKERMAKLWCDLERFKEVMEQK